MLNYLALNTFLKGGLKGITNFGSASLNTFLKGGWTS